MDEEAGFVAALDACPEDHTTRLVYADWLEERGDERAEGYRALGLLRRVPAVKPSVLLPGFCTQDHAACFKDTFGNAGLPDDWLDLVETIKSKQDAHGWGVWRVQKGRRSAEDAAARAFAKLPPERRAELLAAVPA